jgi:hypothetical protein
LAELDATALNGPEWVEVMAAWQRMEVYAAAQKYAAMANAVHCLPDKNEGPADPTAQVDDLAVTVVAAELNLTKASAARHVALADDLTVRRPELLPEMLAGRLDVPRAVAFLDITRGLTPETARKVTERMLPEAGGLTTRQLRAKLRRQAIRLDPEAARARHARPAAERKVVASANADGTASLTGSRLPRDGTDAAMERLTALARAAQEAGDTRCLDALRADLMLELLLGTAGSVHLAARAGSHPAQQSDVPVSSATNWHTSTMEGSLERLAALAGISRLELDGVRPAEESPRPLRHRIDWLVHGVGSGPVSWISLKSHRFPTRPGKHTKKSTKRPRRARRARRNRPPEAEQ